MDNLHERRALPEGWGWKRVEEVIEKVPLTGKKLKQSDYRELGKLPVIDQGQSFIGGYTDNEDLKVCCELPVVIFGDHTKAIKYVDFDFVAGADGIQVMKPQKIFNPKLFYYFVRAIQLPDKGYARHFQSLERSLIPLLPPPIQHRIVSLLEKAEETKRLRAQADELTDRLLQSVFLEMFGDPVRNPKGWEEGKLGDFFSDVRYGVSIKSSSKGYPIIGMNSISYDGRINWNDLSKVELSPDTFRKEKLEKYDLLFNRTNASNLVGKTGIVDKEIDAVAASYLIRLRIKSSFQPYFVWYLMNSPFLKAIFCQKCKKAVNQANINSKELAAFPAIFPPLPLQQKFARIVEKIECMRRSQNQSKQQIEDLFSALMQKAFRGEILGNGQEILIESSIGSIHGMKCGSSSISFKHSSTDKPV